MHRFFARLVPLAVLLLVVSGCGGDETVDTPTEPAPTTIDGDVSQASLTPQRRGDISLHRHRRRLDGTAAADRRSTPD